MGKYLQCSQMSVNKNDKEMIQSCVNCVFTISGLHVILFERPHVLVLLLLA